MSTSSTLGMVLLLSVLAPTTLGQSDPRDTGDPRTGIDPRDHPDPRFSVDPRDIEQDPRDVADPREEAIQQKEFELFDELSGEQLIDALYEQGDRAELARVMRDEQWRILRTIDGECEEWLATVELERTDAVDRTESRDALETKARDLAALGDTVLLDSQFEVYVDNFFSWTPAEQEEFRASQESYRKGVVMAQVALNTDEAQGASGLIGRSLATTRELGDLRGQAMALAVVGRLHYAQGLTFEARETMRDAVRVGRKVRDLDSVWTALSVIFATSVDLDDFEGAQDSLEQQHEIALEMRDEETAAEVMNRIVNLAVFFGPATPGFSPTGTQTNTSISGPKVKTGGIRNR